MRGRAALAELDVCADFGRRVREERERLGLSVHEVARRSRALRHPVSASAVSRIERGGNVTLPRVGFLADALGVEVRVLLTL